MKKFLPLLCVLLIWSDTSIAQSRLRSAESIMVENGKIVESGVLADGNSTIFVEFVAGDRVAYTQKKENYDGEILPPTVISAPDKPPRARMRELSTFEVITDSGEEVSIVSQYSLLPSRERLRLSLKEDNLEERYGAQVLTRIYDEDEIGSPKLWFYDFETEEWDRLGGILSESSEPDTKVFSSIIHKTGTYTLWDENPSPTYNPNTNQEEIELAEESPFPSVDVNGTTSGFNRDGFGEDGNGEGFIDGIVDGIFGGDDPELELGNRSQTVINNDRENGEFAFDAQLDDALVLEDLEETGPIVVPAIDSTPVSTPPIQEPPSTETIPAVQEEPQNTEENLQSSAPLLQANSFLNVGDLPKTGTEESIKIPWFIFLLLLGIGSSIYFALRKENQQ